LPFTPEKIDAMTADEIAEQTRIEKKRFATKKFEQGKFKDIEAENKKFRELEYWFKLAAEKINEVQPEVFKPNKTPKNDNIVRVLTISDIHAGERVDSRWGKFNLDIMRERFKILIEKVINDFKPCELIIFSGGDCLAGRIHPSIVKLSDNYLDSLFAVTECLINLVGTLITHGFKIKLMPIMGNHGSADSAYNARVLAENYERMIEWAIKLKLGEVKQFEMLQPHFNMGLIKIHDYSVVCVHGDQGATKQLADLERLFRHERVKEVLAGHLHHQKSEEYCGVTVYHQPSFIGAEHYGICKGLVSEPGCRLIEYGKEGRLREHYLRF
jgi:predicted MPP superfamily phosphohydrolase